MLVNAEHNAWNIVNALSALAAQSVRASLQYTKVMGPMPGQGIYRNQPTSA